MSDVMSSGKQNRTVLCSINDQSGELNRVFPVRSENRSNTSQASGDSGATLILQNLPLFSLYSHHLRTGAALFLYLRHAGVYLQRSECKDVDINYDQGK